jgi:predicted phosphohydrolase
MRRIWGIADLHLSFAHPKPMDIFGDHWKDHANRIAGNCQKVIAPDDLLLIPGDLSWALKRPEAEPDLAWIATLPGVKVLAKGNHDFWWDSDKPLSYPGLHDTPYISDDGEIGVAGIRGWVEPNTLGTVTERAQADKIIAREQRRLEKRLKAIEGCKLKYALIHYPPLAAFVPLLREHGVDTILYGHLHMNRSNATPPEQWFGLRALCLACDRLNFTPRLVATLT